LADRLAHPVPEGLELYLDLQDIATAEAIELAARRVEAASLPSGFGLVVEGPIGSLDGDFFDLTRDTEANRETLRRVLDMANRVGATGANIHAISPDSDAGCLSISSQRRLLEAALPLTRYFVESATSLGIQPTVENMPPVLRMRQGGYFYSAIGMPPADLVWLAEQVPGLGVVLDTSHAQLYINARRGVEPEDASVAIWPLRAFVRGQDGVDSLADYASALGDHLAWCHISDATGILGEGVPYGDGDAALDDVMPLLAQRARYLVTETLEPDHDRAIYMRAAQSRMLSLLRGVPA
jgi:sugar phosphate isomerase/epimerase